MFYKNHLIIFGGIQCYTDSLKKIKSQDVLKDMYFFDLEDRIWSSPIIGGQETEFHPTFSYGLCESKENQNEVIFVFGNKINNFKHCILFNSVNQTWTLKKKPKNSIFGFTMAKNDRNANNYGLTNFKELNSKIKKENLEIAELETFLKREIKKS